MRDFVFTNQTYGVIVRTNRQDKSNAWSQRNVQCRNNEVVLKVNILI